MTATLRQVPVHLIEDWAQYLYRRIRVAWLVPALRDPVSFTYMIVDVVFPLRLKPLTYQVSKTAPEVLEGRIVCAPLGRKSARGVVVGIRREAGEMKVLKEIDSFHHFFADTARLSLLRWLSEYYLTPM